MTDQSPNLPHENETLEHCSNPDVALILDQYLEDLQNGRACSRSEFLKKHPDIKDDLVEYLDGIELVAGLGVGSDLVPNQLGDFEIVGPIGQGAMGTVFRAHQRSLKRDVALKVLRYAVPSPIAHKRFEREAELVATLRHNNIVPVYATGQQDDSHYLAMQLIDGPSLATWSANAEADRDPVVIAKWGVQVARALAHAHQRDVIHRDVKPSNLLKENDRIWLTDFGLARRYDDIRMSMTGAMLGTPNYMSPEQAAPGRSPIDFRTDIYSLGASLFELLTGRCVFLAETPHSALAQILSDEPPALREIIPDASHDLETILMKCLEKLPSDRYQTADELADDLEAFAQGRSIKARRPSFPERVQRWKQHNRKAFTWAASTATAVLTVLAVSVAAWFGWNRAVTGTIQFDSDEGPIVGRLIDENGKPTPSFSIPTQEGLNVKGGQYTLQMWAGGRLGENRKIYVDHRTQKTAEIKLSDHGVFPERTIEGFPAALNLGDRDDLVVFNSRGITRVDGRSGDNIWTADASDFIAKVNQRSEEEQKLESSGRGKNNRSLIGKATWEFNFSQIKSYSDHRIPKLVEGPIDINEDGTIDVIVSHSDPMMLLAFDGRTGQLMWHHRAIPPVGEDDVRSRHRNLWTLQKPVSVGDIDADGTTDFVGVFCSRSFQFNRWVDAISGKSGKRIWRKSLPKEWFDVGKQKFPELAMVDDGSNVPTLISRIGNGYNRNGRWRFRYSSAFRGQKLGEIQPWPLLFAGAPDESECFYLFGGNRLISISRKTGEPGGLNAGKPVDLGFFPVQPPKLIQDAKGKSLGFLTAEIIAYADQLKSSPPITRFSLRSFENGKELWAYDAECDPGWLQQNPDWPLVADFVGDSTPEILIVDKAEMKQTMYPTTSGLSSVQLLDASNGKPLWTQKAPVRIRSQDQQIQNLLVGPDADGDRKPDAYVVTPMTGEDAWVYIDILSGATGQRIKTRAIEVPFFNCDRAGINFETPLLLGKKFSPDQKLVVSTKGSRVNSRRKSTAIISLLTGELVHSGNQLENPILADGDGDGHKDLFLVKPRSRERIDLSAQLVSFKAVAGSGYAINGGYVHSLGDIDGDRVRDVVDVTLSYGVPAKVYSGADGKLIDKWELGFLGEPLPLNRDVDGDDVDDFVFARDTSQGFDPISEFSLVSGRKGKLIWTKEFRVDNMGPDPVVRCEDVDGDGKAEILLFHRQLQSSGICSLHLSCFEADSGDVRWFKDIDLIGVVSQRPQYFDKSFRFLATDINRNGGVDIICPKFDSVADAGSIAIDGRDGGTLWQLPQRIKSFNSDYIMPPWRCCVVRGKGSDQQFVRVEPPKGRIAGDTTTLQFFNAQDGEHLSTLTIDGRIVDNYANPDGQPCASSFPFSVFDGQRFFVGVCLEDTEDYERFIAIIDHSGSQPKVVRKVVPSEFCNEENGGRYQSNSLLVVSDLNGDGKTDVAFKSGDELVSVELASGTELSRREMSNAKDLVRDSENHYLRVVAENGPISRIKLLDPRTLETVWDLNKPLQMDLSDVLSSGVDQNGKANSIPRFIFRQSGQFSSTFCAVASSAEFRGEGEAPTMELKPKFEIDHSKDQRLVQPLPWSGQYGLAPRDQRLLSMLSEEIPVALGVIIFPIVFIVFIFRKRSWNLQWFLMFPLLFVVPWLALNLPFTLGTSIATLYGIPEWCGKLIGALWGVPTLIFFGFVFAKLWNFQWRKFSGLVLAALIIGVVYSCVILAFDFANLPEGSYYDIWDPSSLEVLALGCWFVGTWLVFATAVSSIQKWFKGLDKPKPSVA